MRAHLISIVAAAAALMAMPAAFASPITYDLSGVTVPIPGETYSTFITGTFTYDPGTTSLLSADFVFNTPAVSATPTEDACPGGLVCQSGGTREISLSSNPWPVFGLTFQSALGDAPDPISEISIGIGALSDLPGVGEADPVVTPLPPSVSLLLPGLALLGLLGWRRKRKAQTIPA